MLLEFSISNFRSIKDRQTFSMLTSSRVKERYNAPFVLENYKNTEVLKTAVLYGKNNSGKSNVLKAFEALKWLITKSDSFKVGESIKANEVFLFDKQTLNQNTIFEIDFISNQIYYRYEVEFSKKEIIKEKLSYYRPNTTKMKLNEVFSREKNIISFRKDVKESERNTLESIKESMRDNQLILSLSASKKINEHFENAYLFFSQKLKIFSFDSDFEAKIFAKYAMKLLRENESYLEKINDLMKVLDTGLLKIEIQERNIEQFIKFPDNLPDEEKNKIIEMLKFNIEVQHRFFDGEKEIGTKNASLDIESTGTQKLFSLLAIMIDAFENGHTLMIDEFGESLNPYWTKYLIKMFYKEQFNKNNSQLIFATHDTAQFQEFLFAKDQINIVDKDYFGKTEINRFSDFTGIRKDIPFEKWYLSGRLGGVPMIREKFIQFEIEKKDE